MATVTGILRLGINTPLSLRVERAVTVDGQYGPQVKLYDDKGQVCYAPVDVGAALLRAGYLQPDGKSPHGEPQYRAANPGTVTITRRKDRPTEVSVDGAKVAVAAGDASPTSPAKRDPRWDDLARTYGTAFDIALDAVAIRLGRIVELGITPTFDGLMAAVATNLIAADKRQLPAPPAPPPPPPPLDEPPPVLAEINPEDDFLP